MLFLLLSLTCWRLSYMFVEEDGPADIFLRIRRKLDYNWSPLSCVYCTSVWVAFPLAFFTDRPLLYWLPISALAIFVHLIHEKIE